MHLPQLQTPKIPADAVEIRKRIRAFHTMERAQGRFIAHRSTWSTFDADFSRRLGQAGFIGVTWPRKYGGQELSNVARYVITEELLAAGAPCFAHWVADRQSGPQILRFGTETAKNTILPKICRGECFFGIGMSEPNSGSDLATVRTRAEKCEEGWLINGSKIWTSNAHKAHYLIALVRTAPSGTDRHAGLTQFIIDMSKPGITVRPIHNLAGEHDFNEVHFQNYFVPPNMLVGTEGQGWDVVTSELVFERAGPDRFLSSYRLLVELIGRVGMQPDSWRATEIGRLVAHIAALRQMSISVAAMLDQDLHPGTEAALVKDVGTALEREIPEVTRRLLPMQGTIQSSQGDSLAEAFGHVVLNAPSYIIRGGTREILRGIISRGLGLR